MKERGILFSGPMVLALLAGRKTQTRRIVKGEKPSQALGWLNAGLEPAFVASPDNGLSPYGYAGDVLWVREAWRTLQTWDSIKPRHLADDRSKVTYEADPERRNPLWAFGRLRASMHMPRWASRLDLGVTDVKIERLYDISEADAEAEGVIQVRQPDRDGMKHWGAEATGVDQPTPRRAYLSLFEQINGAEAAAENPWLWAVSFEVRR